MTAIKSKHSITEITLQKHLEVMKILRIVLKTFCEFHPRGINLLKT